jgi:transcriptional regulator with XRE-family HTH domain
METEDVVTVTEVVEDEESTEELDPIIQALRKERLARGWNQWDVARRMGYSSPARVSQLESGEGDIHMSTLKSWAETLGMEVLIRAKVTRGRPRANFKK